MHLTFHGAAGCVTGSCTLLEHNNTRVLIDCGIEQGDDDSPPGRQIDSRSFPFDASSVDAVVLTHGHLDHCGGVPRLILEGFAGPVFAHGAGCSIAKIIWADSVRIDQGSGATAAAARLARTRLHPLVYETPFTIGDIDFTLYDAGHILGSSHILAKAGGKAVLFSGDIGPRNTPILRDPFTRWKDNVDAVVIESTYGNRGHRDRWDTIIEFGRIVKQTVARKGVLVVPAFSIGRTQEMLYHLNTLVESGDIPPFPVFLDSPMAQKVTAIYSTWDDCYDPIARAQLLRGDLPLAFRGLNLIEDYERSLSIARERPPFMVIAGSGMCTGGRILNHLKTFLAHQNTTVMIVGWQGSGTLGRKLVDGARTVTIDGERIPVKATIATLGGFSAHADRDQLLDWAQNIPGKDIRWYVNHGEPHAAGNLAAGLEAKGLGEAVAVRQGMKAEG